MIWDARTARLRSRAAHVHSRAHVRSIDAVQQALSNELHALTGKRDVHRHGQCEGSVGSVDQVKISKAFFGRRYSPDPVFAGRTRPEGGIAPAKTNNILFPQDQCERCYYTVNDIKH